MEGRAMPVRIGVIARRLAAKLETARNHTDGCGASCDISTNLPSASPASHLREIRGVNAVSRTKGADLAPSSESAFSQQGTQLRVRQFRPWIVVAAQYSVPPFGHHVRSVIGSRSKEQVVDIDARRHVAVMTDKQSVGYCSSRHFVSYSMGEFGGATIGNDPISMMIATPLPDETTVFVLPGIIRQPLLNGRFSFPARAAIFRGRHQDQMRRVDAAKDAALVRQEEP
jgi:hypothetical protein